MSWALTYQVQPPREQPKDIKEQVGELRKERVGDLRKEQVGELRKEMVSMLSKYATIDEPSTSG